MHTYLKTEFLCAFSILKSMGFMVFVFIYLYLFYILKWGHWSRVSLWPCSWQSSCFNLLSVELYLCWFLVCLYFGSLGWPWTHYSQGWLWEILLFSVWIAHGMCHTSRFFLYLGLFKIFPRTATNPQVQYFLDWEGHVGMLLKGMCRVAQLVCQTLACSIFGSCANSI